VETDLQKKKLCYDGRSVGQSVLVSRPIWSPRPDFYFYQTVAGLLMWGERMSLSCTAVIVTHNMSSIFTVLHAGIQQSVVKSPVPCRYIILTVLHAGIQQSVVKSPVPCRYILFTVLHVTPICMYNTCKA
jgi:hypothetical protein